MCHRTGGHTPGHSVVRLASGSDRLTFPGDLVFAVGFDHPDWHNGFEHDPEEAARVRVRLMRELAATPRAAGGQSPVVPVRLPCGGCRRRLSLGTGRLGLLTACWVRAELDDRMRLNNWSIAASYDTARIFAGLGFGSSTASRSIISRPRRTGLCSGSMQV